MRFGRLNHPDHEGTPSGPHKHPWLRAARARRFTFSLVGGTAAAGLVAATMMGAGASLPEVTLASHHSSVHHSSVHHSSFHHATARTDTAKPDSPKPDTHATDVRPAPRPWGRLASISGTVASAPVASGTSGDSTFPVTETSGGTTVTVDVGSHTKYTVTSTSDVAAAIAGTYVVAQGTRGSDGSLAATALAIVPAPPSPPSPPTTTTPPPTPRGPLAFGEVLTNTGTTITLESFNGATQTVTITGTPPVTQTVAGTLSSVGSGDTVQVAGIINRAGTTLDAFLVNVGVPPAVMGLPFAHGGPGKGHPKPKPKPSGHLGMISGTVGASPAVSGTSGTSTFAVTETSGTTVTVDVNSSTHYTVTTTSDWAAAVAGTYVEAKGTSSNGTLDATDLAIVPAPPAPKYQPQSDPKGWASDTGSYRSTSDPSGSPDWSGRGSFAFGKVASNTGTVITLVNPGGGTQTETITASGTPDVTLTVAGSLASVGTGDTVQLFGIINGAGTTINAFSVNVGVPPAVTGPSFGPPGPPRPGPYGPAGAGGGGGYGPSGGGYAPSGQHGSAGGYGSQQQY